MNPVTLSPREVWLVVRLLRHLNLHLRSSIECCVPEGATEPPEDWLKPVIARDRAHLRASESLLAQLTGKTAKDQAVAKRKRGGRQ